MVSPDVGIWSEYVVVYFRVYIYVRLVMSGYLFFCIHFNVWYITWYPKWEEAPEFTYKVIGKVLALGLLVVVYKIPYSSCMWTRQDVIGVFPSYYCNVRACNSPVYHYIAATVVYLVQRVIAACVVVIWFERSEFLIDTSPQKNPSVCPCARMFD